MTELARVRVGHPVATGLDMAIHRVPAELAIVVPTFNEAANVPLLVDALNKALAGIAWEVIFVDDNSPDGTADVVRSIALHDPRVRCIRRVGRRGLSGAAIEGMLSASADVVAVMDGDLQHDERVLPSMLAHVRNGAGLVVASRFADEARATDGLSANRLRNSTYAIALAKKLLGVTVSDPLSGFFMMRRQAFDAVAPNLSTQGFKILLDILASAKPALKIEEVPMVFRARQHGESKLDELVVVEYLSLLLAKATGDRVSLRFILFGLVGVLGIGVHLCALKAALAMGVRFDVSQMTAAYVAMTSNFFLNNILTYRDRRLRGFDAVKGLLSFYAVCSVGMVANVGVGQLIYQNDVSWWLAGIAGAAMGAVFNYAATSVFTWRK